MCGRNLARMGAEASIHLPIATTLAIWMFSQASADTQSSSSSVKLVR